MRKDYPLNVMYWAVREDGNYEVIDGMYFDNLPNDHRQQILNYTLTVYFCSGDDSEKLGWFTTINIAGKEHTAQELRNAVYAGSARPITLPVIISRELRSGRTMTHDTDDLEEQVAKLMEDEDVERKPGIYPYVLGEDEKHLNIRAFTPNAKREAYERQKGICPKCKEKKKWQLDEMEADHIKPWHEGGQTTAKNCQLLCKDHNRRKSGK